MFSPFCNRKGTTEGERAKVLGMIVCECRGEGRYFFLVGMRLSLLSMRHGVA